MIIYNTSLPYFLQTIKEKVPSSLPLEFLSLQKQFRREEMTLVGKPGFILIFYPYKGVYATRTNAAVKKSFSGGLSFCLNIFNKIIDAI